MAPLPPSEFADLAAKLQVLLSSKPYACSSLEQLTGGTTSFVFLGTLSTQLLTSSSKQEYVIVKHAAPFASCHTEFLLDAGRAVRSLLLLNDNPLDLLRSTEVRNPPPNRINALQPRPSSFSPW